MMLFLVTLSAILSLCILVLAVALFWERANNRRIEEEQFFQEYKDDDWAPR